MSITIALAGNPNAGKTTVFNLLTGSNQFVGNWPGVTVEKKEGRLKGSDAAVTDLPGVYSLSPYTLEEVVARDYLLGDGPDVILNIIDGSNLERNLYLTTQLAELGLPMAAAVNMMDVVEKRGDKLDLPGLSRALGIPVLGISAIKGEGTADAAREALKLARDGGKAPRACTFSPEVEAALGTIEAMLPALPRNRRRWYAIKLFERDEKVMEALNLPAEAAARVEEAIVRCEESQEDDAESILTSERYTYISGITEACCQKAHREALTPSDKIDRVVTNRFLALPIFALVMFAVYFVSVTTVGAFLTDWTNDTLFGEWLLPWAAGGLEAVGCAPWLQGLLVDGILSGVGAVLGFVPQMLVLFVFLALLESCGYMARVAFIMDRIFRKFGLSGKSFIPMLIGTGCGVPGIMASRTIENERDRRMTIMTTTFIPCGAKLPIIALIAGALFDGAWWVAPSAYFVGIAAVVLSGILLRKTRRFSGEPAPFVMELPAYHMPTVGAVARSAWERGWSFIKKAGTVILLSAILVWFTSYFGFVDGRFTMLEESQLNQSLLAWFGTLLSGIFLPLGWGDWRASVAAITGLVAKENVVGTFGILYGFGAVAEDGVEIWAGLRAAFTPAAAYSFLVFNLLCAPCFAAMGAIKREMNSRSWFWYAVGYQTALAYVAALWVYQFGTLLSGGGFTFWTGVAVLLLAGFLYLVLRPGNPERALKKRTLGVPA